MLKLDPMTAIAKIVKDVINEGFYNDEWTKKNTYYIDKNIISNMNDDEINYYNKIMDVLYNVGFKFKFAV